MGYKFQHLKSTIFSRSLRKKRSFQTSAFLCACIAHHARFNPLDEIMCAQENKDV